MTASKIRKVPTPKPEREVTARPSPIADRFDSDLDDVGLSVDPDDLGRQALRSALQESGVVPDRELAALSLARGAATDEALSGGEFDPEAGIWQRTINSSLEAGGIDATRESSWPDDEDNTTETLDQAADADARQLDLTHDNIREGSLFDREGAEGDDTLEPDVHADNSSSEHARDSGFLPVQTNAQTNQQPSARQQPVYKAGTRARRRRSSTMG
jgi:hypothetical protein